MADDFADVAQPEGQGDAGTTDAPYSEYLNRIPEEVRGDVEPVFKDWDKSVTQRFQQASEYRKGWEPYEQVGVNRYDPAAVQWALQFFEAQQSNPQAIQEWFQQYAQEHGLEAAQQAAEQLQGQEDPYGYADPSQQQLEALLQQKLSPFEKQLQQMNERFQMQEEQQRIAEAQAFIDSQLKGLEEKHGDEFNRDWVEKFIGNHIESNPEQAVELAWQDFQALRNQLEKATLQSKVDAPPPAETGGFPDTNPDEIKSWKRASEIALQTLRQQNRA